MEEHATSLANGYVSLAAWIQSGTLPFALRIRASKLERGMHLTLSKFFVGGDSLRGIDMAQHILVSRSSVNGDPSEELHSST